MLYRHVTEYNDIEAPPTPTMATPRKKEVRFGQSSFANMPYGPELPKILPSSGSKRNLTEVDLEGTNDVALFKRLAY